MRFRADLRSQDCFPRASVLSNLLNALDYWSYLGVTVVAMVVVPAVIGQVVMLSKLHAYEILCCSGEAAEISMPLKHVFL